MLGELTDEKDFYRAVQRLAELAWQRRLTVETLMVLAELLEPPTDEIPGPRRPT